MRALSSLHLEVFFLLKNLNTTESAAILRKHVAHVRRTRKPDGLEHNDARRRCQADPTPTKTSVDEDRLTFRRRGGIERRGDTAAVFAIRSEDEVLDGE